MITQTHCLLYKLIEARALPTTPISRHLRMIAESGKLEDYEAETLNDAANLIEEAMAKAPTKVLKGIPIGNFDAIADKMGNMKIKPKRKPPGQTLNQAYASKNKRRFKGVAK